MIEPEKIKELKIAFKRIFAMPIGRSTLREIQNVVLIIAQGNTEKANEILETLLTGEIKDPKTPGLKAVVDEYSVQVNLAREIFERGEFVNNVFSEIIGAPEQLFFVNRLRRVDGQEFHFISDVESTFQLMNHLAARLKEVQKTPSFENVSKMRMEELKVLKSNINELFN